MSIDPEALVDQKGVSIVLDDYDGETTFLYLCGVGKERDIIQSGGGPGSPTRLHDITGGLFFTELSSRLREADIPDPTDIEDCLDGVRGISVEAPSQRVKQIVSDIGVKYFVPAY